MSSACCCARTAPSVASLAWPSTRSTTVAVNFMHDMAFEGRAWATHTLLQGLGTAAPALFASDA